MRCWDTRPVDLMNPDLFDLTGDAARVVRTVVFIDVVESVRLIEENEEDAVRRWREVVRCVESKVLPSFKGRIVKSLGDGLMLEFERVGDAIRAAFAIRSACRDINVGIPPERHIVLRMVGSARLA
jgi:adenylate cyclase